MNRRQRRVVLSGGIGLLFMTSALLWGITALGFADDPGARVLMAAAFSPWLVVVVGMALRGRREYRKAAEE